MESKKETNSESSPEPTPPEQKTGVDSAPPDTVVDSNEGPRPDESDAQTDPQMPDPSSLLGLAAMHMQTRDLIHVLMSVFDAHAWRAMGLVADFSGDVRKDLESAQTSIDCLAFMLSKIETTLDPGEKRDVQRRLMDLRMNYVAKSREE